MPAQPLLITAYVVVVFTTLYHHLFDVVKRACTTNVIDNIATHKSIVGKRDFFIFIIILRSEGILIHTFLHQ